MGIPLSLRRHLLWRRRVAAARAWQEAERHISAQQNAAVRRILSLADEQRGTPERPVSG